MNTGQAPQNMSKMVDLPPFSALILDVDGVVLDTEPTYRTAWVAAANNLGYPLTDGQCRHYAGKSFADIEKSLLALFGQDFPINSFKQQSAEIWQQHAKRDGISKKPGLAELLQSLQISNIPFGLATNSRAAGIQKCMAYANLDGQFSIFLTRDDVVRGKPDPEIYLAATQALGFPPDQCLVVEDSETGLIAANSAGTIPILIPDGIRPAIEIRNLAYAELSSLRELAGLIVEHDLPSTGS